MSIKPVFEFVRGLKGNLENLSVEALEAKLSDANLLLVDVREIQEQVDSGTIPGSRLVPRGMLEFWADPQSPYYRDFFTEDRSIVVFCGAGARSVLAARALIEMGYARVAHLEVGFKGWVDAGRPVEDVATKSRWMRKPKRRADTAPRLRIHHTSLRVRDVAASKAFFIALGMAASEDANDAATLETGDGTQIRLVPGEPDAEPAFELVVEDVESSHTAWQAAGIEAGAIGSSGSKRGFTVVEPGGNRIVVSSERDVPPQS